MWSRTFGSGCENGEIAPDGKIIAVGIEEGANGTICFLNVSDGSIVKKIPYVQNCDRNKDSKCNEIEAEEFHSRYGTQTEGGLIGYFDSGDYLRYKVDFGTGAASVKLSVAVIDANAGHDIVLRLDNPSSGAEIGRMSVASTGGWNTVQEQTTAVSGATGVHDLYITLTGPRLLRRLSFPA